MSKKIIPVYTAAEGLEALQQRFGVLGLIEGILAHGGKHSEFVDALVATFAAIMDDTPDDDGENQSLDFPPPGTFN